MQKIKSKARHYLVSYRDKESRLKYCAGNIEPFISGELSGERGEADHLDFVFLVRDNITRYYKFNL
jgi:hypothetical protein